MHPVLETTFTTHKSVSRPFTVYLWITPVFQEECRVHQLAVRSTNTHLTHKTLTERLAPLQRCRLRLALTRGLVLRTARLGLVRERLLEQLLLLRLVDVFHQHALVLELVPMGLEVQRVIQVLVDLLPMAVLG